MCGQIAQRLKARSHQTRAAIPFVLKDPLRRHPMRPIHGQLAVGGEPGSGLPRRRPCFCDTMSQTHSADRALKPQTGPQCTQGGATNMPFRVHGCRLADDASPRSYCNAAGPVVLQSPSRAATRCRIPGHGRHRYLEFALAGLCRSAFMTWTRLPNLDSPHTAFDLWALDFGLSSAGFPGNQAPWA